MARPRERFKIDRAFLRAIVADGKYHEYADDELRGFVVKVAPGGTVAYTIRWYRPDGKQGRKVIGYFPQLNPGEARELARKALADTDKKHDTTGEMVQRRQRRTEADKIIGSAITLGGFLDGQYGDWLQAHNRTAETTIARLKVVFEKFLNKPLADFNAWIIEKWRAQRAKEVKPSTINRELNALKPVFSRAVAWGLIAVHPLTAVKPMKETGGTIVRFLSDEEESALRKAMDAREERLKAGRANANEWRATRNYETMPELSGAFADHLKPMILLSMNTGIRQGELLSLHWSDVALDRAIVTIQDAHAKSGKTRHIPLNKEALATLKAWREQSPGEVVFPGRKGQQMTEVKTAWRKLLDDAGITGFRWHDLRHHFASRLVMAGVDLNTVRELLGHGDLKMTLRYAHLAPEHKAAAVAKLDRKPKRGGNSAKAA